MHGRDVTEPHTIALRARGSNSGGSVDVVENDAEPGDGKPTISNLTGTRFERILATVEKELRLALDKARDTTSHAGDKGSNVEAAVRDVLRQYMPASFGVGNGKVYDAYDDESRQTDVIITNADHPISYPDDQSGAYIIDGVAAVGEVKSVLTTTALDDCIKKGSVFKRLRPSLAEGDHIPSPQVHALYEEMGGTPPFFVIAFENEVAMTTLHDLLSAMTHVPVPDGKGFDDGKGNAPQPPIDAVCLLGEGVLWNLRPGNVPIQISAGRQRVAGWVAFPSAAPLALTLGWLHMSMPHVSRARSVFAPYLFPSARHLNYIASKVNPGTPSGETSITASADG